MFKRRIAVFLLTVMVATGCGSASTTATPMPSDLPLDAYAPDLPSGVALRCQSIPLNAVVQGDVHDSHIAWLITRASADRLDVLWPEGYRARFAPALEILDPSDQIVLRAGEVVTRGCSSGLPGTVWLEPPFGVDQGAAIQIARDYFAVGHGAGATVTNVTILSINPGTDAGRPIWKVNISGDVTEAGRTSPSYTSYEWLYVYADTGEVRVFAQG